MHCAHKERGRTRPLNFKMCWTYRRRPVLIQRPLSLGWFLCSLLLYSHIRTRADVFTAPEQTKTPLLSVLRVTLQHSVWPQWISHEGVTFLISLLVSLSPITSLGSQSNCLVFWLLTRPPRRTAGAGWRKVRRELETLGRACGVQ